MKTSEGYMVEIHDLELCIKNVRFDSNKQGRFKDEAQRPSKDAVNTG